MALSTLRWGLVTRSTSEKRKRYTSSCSGVTGERGGQRERGQGLVGDLGSGVCTGTRAEPWNARAEGHQFGAISHLIGREKGWVRANNQSLARPRFLPSVHVCTHTRTFPFPAFLPPTLTSSPSVHLPSFHAGPRSPHLPFSSLLHSHRSLQQQLPGVLRADPQHGGHQVQGAEWTQVLRDTEGRGSGHWQACQPPRVASGSPTSTLSLHPSPLGARASTLESLFYSFALCPLDPHHWEGMMGTPWWHPSSGCCDLCLFPARLPLHPFPLGPYIF